MKLQPRGSRTLVDLRITASNSSVERVLGDRDFPWAVRVETGGRTWWVGYCRTEHSAEHYRGRLIAEARSHDRHPSGRGQTS